MCKYSTTRIFEQLQTFVGQEVQGHKYRLTRFFSEILSPLSPNMGHISICGALVQVVKRFGATNGCSVVPNSWLNEEVRMVNDDDDDSWNEVKFSIFFFETIHQACIIHDLCYSTIGANRTLCDRWVALFGCRHVNLHYLTCYTGDRTIQTAVEHFLGCFITCSI